MERGLSMEAAIEEALQKNARLAAEQARSAIARAESRATAAPLWPRVTAEAGYTRSVDPVFAFGTKLRRSQFGQDDFDLDRLNDPDPITDWTAGLIGRWSVLDPKHWARRSAARNRADAAAWSAERSREATILGTRILYLRAVQARNRLAAATVAEEAARRTYDTFRRRRDRGLLTEADLLQAEAELAAAEASRAEADRGRLDALQMLGLHLGWSPDTVPLPTDTLEPPAPTRREETYRASQRADLKALAARVGAADAARRRSALDFVPALDLFAAFTKHAGGLFASDATDWTVGVTLRWTLFSGLGRVAELERAGLQQRVARIEYDQALRAARTELDQAERAVRTARQGVEATRVARRSAEAGRELMRRRFEEGLATAAELLQAEARATEMRERAIAALADYHIAVARLEFVRSGTKTEDEG